MTKKAKFPIQMDVQAILFPLDNWTPKTARAWLLKNKFKTPRPEKDSSKNYLRYRQADPAGFDTFKTISLGNGIQAIVGCPVKNPQKQKPLENPERGKHSIPPVLVHLGHALEIELEGQDKPYTFQGFDLLSSTDGKRLYILPEQHSKTPTRSKLADRAKRLFKRFHDFTARDVYKVPAPPVIALGQLLGYARSVSYESEKWTGKETAYIHRFDQTPIVLADRKRSPRAFALIGRIAVKAEGITG